MQGLHVRQFTFKRNRFRTGQWQKPETVCMLSYGSGILPFLSLCEGPEKSAFLIVQKDSFLHSDIQVEDML